MRPTDFTLTSLLWSRRHTLLLALPLLLINRASTLVMPLAARFVIDTAIGRHDVTLLSRVGVLLCFAAALEAASSYAVAEIVSISTERFTCALRRTLYTFVMALPVSCLDATRKEDLIASVTLDTDRVKSLLGQRLVDCLGGCTTILLAFLIIGYFDFRFAIVVGLLIGLSVMRLWRALASLRATFLAHGALTAKLMGHISESLYGIRIVRLCGAELRRRLLFTKRLHDVVRTTRRLANATARFTATSTLAVRVIHTIVLVSGGVAAIYGWMSMGDLVGYLAIGGLLTTSTAQTASMISDCGEAIASIVRIQRLLQLRDEPVEGNRGLPFPRCQGEIAFEDVSFEYDSGVRALSEVSFVARPGSITAIVGPSGSGKTTIADLLCALSQPTHGRILIDGFDLKALRLRDYRRFVGVVPQDSFLFDGSIGENISFAAPHAPIEQLAKAASLSHCCEFIERCRDGYSTAVGERGVLLSGGQRQRIALARALLLGPRIVILDEATTNVDAVTENAVLRAIRGWRGERTIFVISHNMSFVRGADQILVLDSGRLVESGTHESLVARDGQYAALCAPADRLMGSSRYS